MKKIIALSVFFLFLSFGAKAEGLVVINEIAWMGGVKSYLDEWIELRNMSDAEIDLDGWTLKAADGSPKIALAGKIPAGGFFVLERTDDETVPEVVADQIFTGSLEDGGEDLVLTDGEGNAIDRIDNSGGWLGGDKETKRTMERVGSGWQSSAEAGGTPKAENSGGYIAPVVTAPMKSSPAAKSSGSSAAPAENKTSTDSKTAVTTSTTPTNMIMEAVEKEFSDDAKIVLSEIYPNPPGADADGEWIEVLNGGNRKSNLLGWTISAGGKSLRSFTIERDVWLEAGEYFAIEHDESGLLLNNTTGKAVLANPQGAVVSEVAYEKSYEGMSCIVEGGYCQWTEEVTPGRENLLLDKDEKGLDRSSVSSPTPSARTAVKAATAKTSAKTTTAKASTKTSASSQTQLVIRGIVTALPGSLARQYFYVHADDGGWQIYKYDGVFPKLTLGDMVELAGERTEAAEGRRIKLAKDSVIKTISQSKAIEPEISACDSLEDIPYGTLVRVSGEVTDKKSSYIYLDDGAGEIKIYGKKSAGIDFKTMKEGQSAEVIGILERTSSETRILPRDRTDIKVLGKDATMENGQVLGESASSGEWKLEADNSNTDFLKYGSALMLALFSGFVIWKKKGNVV